MDIRVLGMGFGNLGIIITGVSSTGDSFISSGVGTDSYVQKRVDSQSHLGKKKCQASGMASLDSPDLVWLFQVIWYVSFNFVYSYVTGG